MAPVRLLELRNTYKWGGGPDKTILLSAARHDQAVFPSLSLMSVMQTITNLR